MNVKILLLNTNDLKEIKISSDVWREIHNHRVKHFFKKEYSDFLKEHNLKPTYFNLNCLDELRGVILTDLQIKERVKRRA